MDNTIVTIIRVRRRSMAAAFSLFLALASFTFAEAARADIQVGSIADSRFGFGYTLDGGSMTVTRSKLLNAANFGAGGTVGEAIVITDTAATITESLLSSFDVFFIGYLLDTSANAFSGGELAAFEAWVEGGGTMVVTCDSASFDAVCAHFGHPATNSSVNPHTPTAKGSDHPIFDGPFGVAASLNMSGTQGYFADTTGATIMAVDGGGLPTVLFRHQGAGRVILYADVDMISNFTLSAGTAITTGNDLFLANQFAFAGSAPAVVNTFDIQIGSIADSRFGTGYSLDGTFMTMTREKLENLANFGPEGTVNRTVEITDVTDPITEALLADFEVFFIGYLTDSSANAFTNAELFAFEAWVNGGGNMVVTCDDSNYDAVCAHFGHPATTSSADPHTPTVAGAVHPLFEGPFGSAPSIVMAGTRGYFTATGGATVLAEDAGGNPTVLEKTLGAGRVVLMADVNIIAVAGLTDGNAITNNNDRFLANTFAYAGPNRPVANDFNGDGESDILWRNTATGNVLIWLIDDFGKAQSGSIGNAPVAFDMVGTGDFNRDGRADIFWRNPATGFNVIWLMTGFAKTSGAIPSSPVVWSVSSIKDYDGDGAVDILWRNTSTGLTLAWQMNGLVRQSANPVSAVPNVFRLEE